MGIDFMITDNECLKCGGKMTRGFFFDRGHMEYKTQQAWVEGEPEESFWSGVKTSGRDAYRVEAFRCASCDRLEFYTTERVDV